MSFPCKKIYAKGSPGWNRAKDRRTLTFFKKGIKEGLFIRKQLRRDGLLG